MNATGFPSISAADDDPDVTDPDDDNDGMPDSWEITHGLDPFLDDRSGDPDADGHDNWFEFVSDTDPQDPFSKQAFAVEGSPDSVDATLRFSTSADRVYLIESSGDLTPGSWQDLGPEFAGSGGEMTVPDTGGPLKRFYRLRVGFP